MVAIIFSPSLGNDDKDDGDEPFKQTITKQKKHLHTKPQMEG